MDFGGLEGIRQDRTTIKQSSEACTGPSLGIWLWGPGPRCCQPHCQPATGDGAPVQHVQVQPASLASLATQIGTLGSSAGTPYLDGAPPAGIGFTDSDPPPPPPDGPPTTARGVVDHRCWATGATPTGLTSHWTNMAAASRTRAANHPRYAATRRGVRHQKKREEKKRRQKSN